ncbi:MAG: Rpn family recombination-promoting nuclease/putative transposase, partial [Moraxellaceae bacterium]|nr:Rpn family recombination-promoting nuclease/putative transposase [Moraxellaceae bacterium]
MSTITHSHDKLFKTVFSKKEAVAEFIEKLLPKDISQHIDLNSLELDNTEYIDEQLKTHCSDIVYNCNYLSEEQNKPIPIKISLLFEHKSYQEKYPHLQLMRYFLNMWEMQNKQKQSLTPIIPSCRKITDFSLASGRSSASLFPSSFHGKSKWNKKPLTDYFAELDDNLKQFLPNFDYLLLDTNQYENKDFQQLNVAELQYSILMMKHIFNMEKLLENLADIFTNIEQFIATEQGRKFFQTMVIYLYQYSDLNADEWREKMHNISPQVEKEFISTYDQAINTGIQKGKLEGSRNKAIEIANNLKMTGLDLASIAKATGLTIAEVSK